MNIDDALFTTYRRLALQPWMQPLLDRLLSPFNPFSPLRHEDPYQLYRQARRRGPVFYHRPIKTWIVTGYDEAIQVLRGPVSVDRRRTFEPLTPYNKMNPANIELLLSNMLMSDDPDHGRLRRLANRAFTARAVAELQPRITSLAEELIDDLTPEAEKPDTVDVMRQLANRLPIYVIAELLGLPQDDRDELKKLSDVVAKFVDPFHTFDPVQMDQAIDRLEAMFDRLASQRLSDPRPDLLTALVRAEADGDRLNRRELISMVLLLLLAGHETTSGLIGNALVALARNPESRRQLRVRPDLVPNAVEELLRYDTPIQATDRTAMETFPVGPATIDRGSLILVLFGAANRDPRRHHNADRLWLERPDPHPISFGHGAHHCIGAALARAEVAAVIPAFVSAFPHYRVDEDRLIWKRSTTFRGPTTLPVRLEP